MLALNKASTYPVYSLSLVSCILVLYLAALLRSLALELLGSGGCIGFPMYIIMSSANSDS